MSVFSTVPTVQTEGSRMEQNEAGQGCYNDRGPGTSEQRRKALSVSITVTNLISIHYPRLCH